MYIYKKLWGLIPFFSITVNFSTHMLKIILTERLQLCFFDFLKTAGKVALITYANFKLSIYELIHQI